jgi:hypothetical protein
MKSSTISNPFLKSGSELGASIVERIMPAPVYRGTFNTIVSAIVATMSPLALIVVDTQKRTVTVAEGDLEISIALNNGMNDMDATPPTLRTFHPTDNEARSAGIQVKDINGNVVTSGVTAPEGQTELDAAFDAALGAQETSKSLGTLADAVADAVLSQAKHAIIILDQKNNSCSAYIGDSTAGVTAKDLIDDEVSGATLAVFNVAVPEAAPSGFFGA